jgi:hypothetical protein
MFGWRLSDDWNQIWPIVTGEQQMDTGQIVYGSTFKMANLYVFLLRFLIYFKLGNDRRVASLKKPRIPAFVQSLSYAMWSLQYARSTTSQYWVDSRLSVRILCGNLTSYGNVPTVFLTAIVKQVNESSLLRHLIMGNFRTQSAGVFGLDITSLHTF